MTYLVVVLFVLGLCIGSFVNVLIDRLPKGQNPLRGRSRCDHCRKTLQPIDLIPLLSFVLLRGKCRYCHKKLSWQYPLIELVTGLLFVGLFMYLNNSSATELFSIFWVNYLALLSVFTSLLVIFVADLKYQIIPDEMLISSFIGITLLLFIKARFYHISIYDNVWAAIVAATFFGLIYLVTKGRGMGLGDVKLVGVLGFLLGWPQTLVGIYAGFLTGALFSIILVLRSHKKWRDKIAFGPFLVLGAIIAFFYSTQITQWYLSLFRF